MKLSNIFELKASASNESLYTKLMQLNGNSPRYSDVKYTAIAQEGYMRNWIIYRCVQEIIRAAIQLNWKVMKYNNKGEAEEIRNHPMVQVLEKPNPLYGQAELIKRAIAFYYIGGESPFHKTIAGGNPKELYVYRPDRVSFASTGEVEMPYTNVRYNGRTLIDIPSEQFMLWKNFNPLDEFDGLGHGMSMLEPILKNGDLLNEMINWNMSLTQNGGNLSGVIAVEDTLPDKQYDRAKAELKNNHQGSRNVGKYLLLEGGAKYIPTSVNPKDMDWKEGKASVMLDVCIGIGVDPIIIGINEHSSYNNKNEAEKGLYTKLVIPLMRELADQLNEFLGLDDNEYLDVDYSHIPCLQEDMKELSDRLKNAEDLTLNEKRKARGLEPVDGGDIIVGSNFILKDGKLYKPMALVSAEEEDKQINNKPIKGNPSENQTKSEDFFY